MDVISIIANITKEHDDKIVYHALLVIKLLVF